MPRYVYHCPKCHKTINIIHSVKEAGESMYHHHYEGGKRIAVEMERVWLPINIFFKGSGFYCTDNPKGGD